MLEYCMEMICASKRQRRVMCYRYIYLRYLTQREKLEYNRCDSRS